MATKKSSTIHDPRYKNLISRLSSLRKESGLLQEDIAARLGLSQSDISKIERCERRLDAVEFTDYLRAIAPEKFSYLLAELIREIIIEGQSAEKTPSEKKNRKA